MNSTVGAWQAVVLIAALTAIALVAMLTGYDTLAGAAVGALVGGGGVALNATSKKPADQGG